MKRTELERRVRKLRREQKHAEYIERVEGSRDARSVANYIEELFGMLYYNDEEIMNIPDNMEIFELFEDLKEEHPERQWHNVVRKAVRDTKVAKRKQAIKQLTEYIEM